MNNLNENSKAIIIFCSHLCVDENMVPLEPKEWSFLASKLMEQELSPKDLLNFTVADFQNKLDVDFEFSYRLYMLTKRSASIMFEVENLSSKGIYIITRADDKYPSKLKSKLKNLCPPLFYYSGNLDLLKDKFIGFVGSRTITDDDKSNVKQLVLSAKNKGYSVVSGGAKGIDIESSTFALANGCNVVEFLSDSLSKKVLKSEFSKYIRSGNLLLLSTVKPTAGFNVGFAMARNKYIYCASEATIVMKSDLDKGGTWSGAIESLNKNYSSVCIYDNPKYKGNQALINKGGIPITTNWNFNFVYTPIKEKVKETSKQLSLEI